MNKSISKASDPDHWIFLENFGMNWLALAWDNLEAWQTLIFGFGSLGWRPISDHSCVDWMDLAVEINGY